ncbi:MAG TPA: pyruvate kinase [Gammaproteobacteria bacterium]|nr:pyruvate kinase [Gammaproteobacteria bacterium]
MTVITDVQLLKYRRTKIIATLGPASSESKVIRKLIEAGVNVIRLNMSHGDHDGHARIYERVRAIADELKQPVAVFADLCGPKIRTGKFRDGQITLTPGETVTVTTRDVPGEPGLIPSQYEALARDVKPGDRILINDGVLELQVGRIDGTEITCSVIHGGLLKNHKGINLPHVQVSAPSLTDKDRLDAEFALKLGVDFLALSFVRRASDLDELRALIRARKAHVGIIAKIEKPEALNNASAILEAADAIMVARGDLGVELNAEQVPTAQNQLINMARAKNKPVIVATQMLESMIENVRPTRAEVTDVSHAVAAGTDAVMLSAETAAGKHPIAAVEMMTRIAKQAEAFQFWQRKRTKVSTIKQKGPIPFGDAVADAAARLSYDLDARAVLVLSSSGMSAVTVSASRPWAPIVGISANAATCRRMNLMWGIVPILIPEVSDDNAIQIGRRVVQELGLAKPGEYILLIRGFHGDPQLNTPSITLLAV